MPLPCDLVWGVSVRRGYELPYRDITMEKRREKNYFLGRNFNGLPAIILRNFI